MSDEEAKKKKAAEDKAESLRLIKLEEARKLIIDMKIKCDNADMPTPLLPGKVMKSSVELQTNLFGIRMEGDILIYKYDVNISSDIGKKHVEFTKKSSADYIISDRKRKCMAVFDKAVKEAVFHRENLVYFYDGQSLMYTTEKLVFKDPTKPNETVIIEGEKISQELEPFKFIYFAVKECEGEAQCRLSDIRKIDRDLMKKDRSAMQFVDIVTSMNALSQCENRFTIFANGKIFPNRPDLERIQTVKMKEGKEMIPGISKSIKLVEGPRGRNNASVALAVDSLKVAFHVKEKVLDKAMGFFVDINKTTHHEIDQFTAMVRGLGCNTIHTKTPRRVEIHGISRDNSTKRMEIKIPDSNMTRTMSVAEYFVFKYGIQLKYPNAPLVTSREKGQINLYPMEVLEIIPMQRVTIPQTTSIQSQVATKECAVSPSVRQNAIIDQCKLHDFFNPEQPFLKAAGLAIIDTPLRVSARVLKGPVLEYKDSNVEVLQPNWRPPPNYKFVVPGSCDRWAMYAVLGPRDSFTTDDMQRFADAFLKRCRERGISIVAPSEVRVLAPPPQDKSPDFNARLAIREAGFHHCRFLFFITNDFITIHKHMKLEERYSKVVTQDLKLKTAQNYLQKSQQLTMDNIVSKTNVKLGGMNYSMNIKNIVGPAYDPFPHSRLIIGIGVSHAPLVQFSPKNLEGELPPPPPAVVGYCANMAGRPTEYIGDYLFQDSRKEDLILCTVEMLKNVIDRFTGAVDKDGKRTGVRTKPLPKEMIVYRQGVSEGFYALCIKEEIPLMKAVLSHYGAPDVKVTYIVVQKEHNIRLMPVNIVATDKPTMQNIGSGVVVDSELTHPRYREFFLNSHVTLQGTARTPRYTILNDDGNLSMNELEGITHALAHNFQIVNSPVSIPAPLYIANRYAERGVAVYTAKATDEMATSEQRTRHTYANMNEDLTFGHTYLGARRVNA